jgi:tubulin delta
LQQLIVDTERKVWMKRKEANSIFDALYVDQGTIGRGNNWTHGFYDSANLEQVLDSYRKVVERRSTYDGMMILHSLAGGTGSGLGSRLVQEIRDNYSKGFIASSSFAAFGNGETALQHYNSLLSINVLQKYCDFIGVFSNEHIMANINRYRKSIGGSSVINIDALNEYASACLMGMMLPVSSVWMDNGHLKCSK